LDVLEQTLHVSEYTDHVDVTAAARRGGLKTRRILEGILECCHIATGLAVASGQERQLTELIGKQEQDLDAQKTMLRKKKKKLLKLKKSKKKISAATSSAANGSRTSWAGRDPVDNAALFQTMFEIGRRNKVLNPTSMRTTYGKLMYLLQDAQNPSVAKSLGFSLHKDMVLVQPYLEEHNCADLLQDSRLECAVQHIHDRDPVTGQRLDRAHVQAMVEGKRRVTDQLVETYSASGSLSPENVLRAIDSLADAVAYVESNVQPVQRMLQYLEDNFDPHRETPGFTLALGGSSRGGFSNSYAKYGLSAYSSGSNDGPTLSHSHSTQFIFVWQSLRLWSKVMRICIVCGSVPTTTCFRPHKHTIYTILVKV
jgi:hypothetical protein